MLFTLNKDAQTHFTIRTFDRQVFVGLKFIFSLQLLFIIFESEKNITIFDIEQTAKKCSSEIS